MISTDLLAQDISANILTNINNIEIQIPINTVKSDGSVDTSTKSSTIGSAASPSTTQLNQDFANAIAKGMAAAIVKHLAFLEISNGQLTLVAGSLTGALVGTGGGPAPVAVTGGTISSETGVISVPPGAIS